MNATTANWLAIVTFLAFPFVGLGSLKFLEILDLRKRVNEKSGRKLGIVTVFRAKRFVDKYCPPMMHEEILAEMARTKKIS